MEFDNRDAEILVSRQAAWDKRDGARVGDWVLMRDGTTRRFTHDWGDALQTTTVAFGLGSFYFGDGYMSYSGALDPGVDKSAIRATGEVREADAWFFHHDFAGAHRGVHVKVTARVFKES